MQVHWIKKVRCCLSDRTMRRQQDVTREKNALGRTTYQSPLCPGGFNRSAQHLLILRGEGGCHGDITDFVHGSAEGRAVGAMEERAECCGHLAGVLVATNRML